MKDKSSTGKSYAIIFPRYVGRVIVNPLKHIEPKIVHTLKDELGRDQSMQADVTPPFWSRFLDALLKALATPAV